MAGAGAGDGGQVTAGSIRSIFRSHPMITGGYAVATLPTGVQGDRAFVSDSNAAFTAGIGAVVSSGGANVVPVFFDGTNWRIG